LTAELSERARRYWAEFESTVSDPRSCRLYEAFHFGDSEALATELASLVVAGAKRATASLLWSFEAEHRPAPQAGDLSIVETWSGQPLCVIETTSTEVVAFAEVSAEFAAEEGEGDGSLQSWRTGHWAFFSRECLRLGKEPSAHMPVVCERFKVAHLARPGT
jgi:uncharacterized protein YhfF